MWERRGQGCRARRRRCSSPPPRDANLLAALLGTRAPAPRQTIVSSLDCVPGGPGSVPGARSTAGARMAEVLRELARAAQAQPARAAAVVAVGLPMALLATPVLLTLALFAAPVLVPAFAFVAVSCCCPASARGPRACCTGGPGGSRALSAAHALHAVHGVAHQGRHPRRRAPLVPPPRRW